MTVTRTGARAKLLDAAAALFYREGITATGIDRVIAHAGVAKASLYNNFAGKDELVAAYLRSSLERFDETLTALMAIEDPRERIDAFFDQIERNAASERFGGCPFSRAAVEVGPDSPAHRVIVEFYHRLGSFFAQTVGVDIDDPAVKQLIVCYNGAMTSAGVLGDPSMIGAAHDLARASTIRR